MFVRVLFKILEFMLSVLDLFQELSDEVRRFKRELGNLFTKYLQMTGTTGWTPHIPQKENQANRYLLVPTTRPSSFKYEKLAQILYKCRNIQISCPGRFYI